jgi:hypothetical protein
MPNEYTSIGGARRCPDLSRSGDIHATVPLGPDCVVDVSLAVASLIMEIPKSAILAHPSSSTKMLIWRHVNRWHISDG